MYPVMNSASKANGILFVLVLAALPLPAAPRRSAANDNAPVRRIRVRLAA